MAKPMQPMMPMISRARGWLALPFLALALTACGTGTDRANHPGMAGNLYASPDGTKPVGGDPATTALQGNAPGQGASPRPVSDNDPLEGFNRAVFWFNDGVDTVLIRPLAVAYKAVVPAPARTGVRNVMRNLRSPLDFANQLLQGDVGGAGTVLGRFVINTTVGLGGLIDVAAENGLDYEYESLDQTLAVWGVPEGPYLVLPLLGPSSVRDAVGLSGEAYADPVTNWAQNTDRDWIVYTRTGLVGLDTRAELLEPLDDLKRNSLDYYAAMRSLYRQRRDGLIRDGAPDPSQLPAIPDYGDAK
ncbi:MULTISPECIES: VacJ family lipoprotein [unclassified Azospirillum]|uniref:MlaA family lipoprotein n=1 Tax=unclassified Azospirillum TaxID=2630922 RepID=UPI001FCD08C9|nr:MULTISPECIES: VacJ family lipoprotein [unclassified Azospirillum]